MNINLEQIFELESVKNYNDAYSLYKKLISENNTDFDTWKYYYFFLWSMLEDINGVFTEKIDLNIELQNQLKIGLKNYSELAGFNFIAGYTVSIFSYEYGDFNEFDKKGREMLKKASDLRPENPIYKMAYLALEEPTNKTRKEYQIACKESESKVKDKYSKKGLLNEYFREVLIRTENASR